MTPDYVDGVVHVAIVLNVADIERSIAFYVDHLGFDLVRDEEDAAHDQRVVSLSFGNAAVDLVSGAAPPLSKQHYRLVWEVNDLRPAVQLITQGGGRVVRQMEYGVICADPDGHSILLTLAEPDPEDIAY
jgi:catechol 2,3-dioxygenase-like lactoylglutathione lyase family enzyme